MAPRTGPRVTVTSPNSGTVTMSRSVSLASSAYNNDSGHATPDASRFFRHAPPRHETPQSCGGTAAGAPPPTARPALRAMKVNTSHEASSLLTKLAADRRPPPPANVGAPAAVDGNTASNGRTRTTQARRSLPDYFAQTAETSDRRNAEQQRMSRSHSGRSCRADTAATARWRQHREEQQGRRAEDEEAVRRATAALERAGGSVLRRPLSTASPAGLHVANTSSDSSTGSSRAAASILGGNAAALPAPLPRQPPPPPPTTAARTRRHHSDDEDHSGYSSCGSSTGSASGSRKRARSWAAPTPPTSTLDSSVYGTQPPVDTAPPRVCPGMFAGLSAVPVDARLFADTVATQAGVGAQPRYCVRPLWSLVGTFKTSLGGLVTVDSNQDCVRWSQRNPKGGQQTIRLPLRSILDVFTTRVVQEDERVEERQFTVVVRTSTRPSQVVFGFATAGEAQHLRAVLKSR
ncbi:hypothetical protein NESM_000756700 [Novymonas esmeraldas]|uniref:PH-like domain-containing protein n=1 Tax=Novymonas esmeraldas TaxID=1808958 RepID=A0AAW0EYP4_9TRYP